MPQSITSMAGIEQAINDRARLPIGFELQVTLSCPGERAMLGSAKPEGLWGNPKPVPLMPSPADSHHRAIGAASGIQGYSMASATMSAVGRS
jgi:hypothetical protein